MIRKIFPSHPEKAVKPQDYDPVDKFRDAQINDSGCREVDPEEWYMDN